MQELQVHLVHCDYTEIDSTWDARDVYSGFWRFYFNNRDGAAITHAGTRTPLPANQVHLIPAYLKFTCHNHVPIQHLYAHFDLLGLPPALQQALFCKPYSFHATERLAQLVHHFAAGRLPQNCPISACLMHAAIRDALASLFATLPPHDLERLHGASAGLTPVRAALQRIEQRLPQPISVSELAGACGFGDDHFIRVFRRHLGQTPASYVLQRRLALAAARLLSSDESIERIAQDHGFANRFHFTRAFRTHLATTPAAYRTAGRV